MKTDFSINVNVSLGVTPEVIALVGAILSKKPVPVVAQQQPSKDDHQEDAPQAPQKKPNGRSSKTAKAEQEQQPSGEEAAPGKTEGRPGIMPMMTETPTTPRMRHRHRLRNSSHLLTRLRPLSFQQRQI